MRKKTIAITALAVVVIFFSGWLLGHNTSNCKCNGVCCQQEQLNQDNK